jgi:ABC-type multidrug transport system fused ATPase/permease subunit
MGAGIIFPLVFAPLVIYWLCGIPLWATLMVMATIVTMNVILATRQSRFFFRFKQLAAERTGMVNEWVQNIRLLRILGWTEKYESKIFRKRDEETRNRVAMVTNGQIMGTFGSSISFVINLIGVSSLIFLRGQAVSPGELFALLWIFGVFLARPFRQIPWILTFSLDSLTSLRRLERFFERPSDLLEGAFTDETETVLSQKRTSQQQGIEQPGIPLSVRGLSLKINGKQLLSDVSFDVLPGELVAVVGEVGCGKSLLVLSLVAETGAQFDHFTLGDVDGRSLDPNSRRRYFAFVPQEGFVMSATLRDNVAFRYGVAEQHDDSVVRSLHLAQFRLESEHVSDGLNTEIGERGVNLSGGQRQRVSLARAHHFERPIVLLDDCLSAVDVDTEKQLIRDLIDGAWAKKTRILVTHRLTVLERVDRILFMEDGKIVESGKFDELLVSSARMREFVATVRRSEQAAQQSSPSRAMTSEADAEPVAANTLVMSNVAEVAEAASQSAERTEAGDVEAESVS